MYVGKRYMRWVRMCFEASCTMILTENTDWLNMDCKELCEDMKDFQIPQTMYLGGDTCRTRGFCFQASSTENIGWFT